VNWCFDWILEQQQKPVAESQWPPTKGWGMKAGGLPFHEYVFARYLPEDQKVAAAGDREISKFAAIVFAGKPEPTQLSMFMLMSYAERMRPGAIYRSRP
jgi:hypothetical protein